MRTQRDGDVTPCVDERRRGWQVKDEAADRDDHMDADLEQTLAQSTSG
jgi:hypothetical protein